MQRIQWGVELVKSLASTGTGEAKIDIARKVIAYFTGQRRTPAASVVPDVQLTERETEVLQRVAKGYTLPEIAQQFGLSRHTIADYIKQIYRKLNVSSRAEAALEAARRGLVNP